MSDPFPVQLAFQGKTVTVAVTTKTSADELIELVHTTFILLPGKQQLKLLWKGKRVVGGDAAVFAVPPNKTPKIMVLATQTASVKELNSKRSDPTIRGFDQERQKLEQKKSEHWGPNSVQDKNYKFCRFQACTWQSFGHRPTDATPHDFEALALLEKLATDPGIVAVLKERELVVGTLGEMDPIDDRLMLQTQHQHRGAACLLGYNTNAGARIDLKLRTDDLQSFRPYPALAATLIHELSHNWVGEHDLLFWTNYGQMLSEYVVQHTLKTAGFAIVRGKTTAQLAGLPSCTSIDHVFDFVIQELTQEMAQYRLHPGLIAAAIRDRCDELDLAVSSGRPLGTTTTTTTTTTTGNGKSPRELALQAAERRAKEQEQNPQLNEKKSSK